MRSDFACWEVEWERAPAIQNPTISAKSLKYKLSPKHFKPFDWYISGHLNGTLTAFRFVGLHSILSFRIDSIRYWISFSLSVYERGARLRPLFLLISFHILRHNEGNRIEFMNALHLINHFVCIWRHLKTLNIIIWFGVTIEFEMSDAGNVSKSNNQMVWNDVYNSHHQQ